MTDTTNIGLKKYGVTDPANLLTGYNASMDTLDTIIKQAQDDIDALQDSLASKVNAGSGTNAAINQMISNVQIFSINATANNGHRYGLIVSNNSLSLYDFTAGSSVWTINT